VLKSFFAFVAIHPVANWLHWGMSKPNFGFDVLVQRGRALNLEVIEIPSEHRFDLSYYLQRRFGAAYAPDPRLWHTLRRNGVDRPDLLDKEQSAGAWCRGEYVALVNSLCAKVAGIADLHERVHQGTFQVGG